MLTTEIESRISYLNLIFLSFQKDQDENIWKFPRTRTTFQI